MFCSDCGHPVQVDANYCSNCGGVVRKHQLVTISESASRSLGKIGDISTRVRQRVFGITERSYPFRIEPVELADRLRAAFHSLGFSVSIVPPERIQETHEEAQQHSSDGTMSEAIVEISRSRSSRDSFAVRIQSFKGSTVVGLGRGNRGKGTPFTKGAFVSGLPGSEFYEEYSVASKVWAVTAEYIRSHVSNTYHDRTSYRDTTGLVDDVESFVGRRKEIEEFKKAIESTIRRKPRHIAISGDTGIGKTALLREFHRIASEQGLLVVRRELDPSLTSLSDLALFLMDAMDRESLGSLPAQSKLSDHVTRFVNDHGVTLPSFFGVGGGGISSQRVNASANVVQEKTVAFMKKRAKKLIVQGMPAAVFLLDNADDLNRISGASAFLKTLLDRINENLGYFMIVLAGSNLFRKGASENLSIRRLFSTMRLGSFDETDGVSFLRRIAADPKELGEDDLKKINALCGGHPLVLEVFASEIVEQSDQGRTHTKNSSDTIRLLIPRVLSKLGEGYFLDVLQETTPLERSVLETLGPDQMHLRMLDSKLKKRASAAEIKNVLNSLLERGLVRSESEGVYGPFCPLFGEYLRINSI